jgi:hypothetical protein
MPGCAARAAPVFVAIDLALATFNKLELAPWRAQDHTSADNYAH